MKEKLKRIINKRNIPTLAIILIAILFYIVLINFQKFGAFVGKLLGYFSPFVIGVVIAYLLSPVVAFMTKVFFKKMKRKKLANAISVAISVIIIIAIIVLLLLVIVPEIFNSIETLVGNVDNYLNTLGDFLNSLTEKMPMIEIDVDELLGSWDGLIDTFIDWAKSNFNNIMNVTVDIGSAVVEFFLSFIIAIYILLDRENISKYMRRVLTVFMKPEKYERFDKRLTHINKVFTNYITAEVTDATIVLIANYIFMSIFKMPYPLLISVIVAITNLIPNFGPFIGGIPSALLILIINPMDAIIFVIWTVGLQFIDGNFVRPMLLGDSLELPPVAVLISIAVGGKMFGIAGMVLAAPVVSILKEFFDEIVDAKEKKLLEEMQDSDGTDRPEDDEPHAQKSAPPVKGSAATASVPMPKAPDVKNTTLSQKKKRGR